MAQDTKINGNRYSFTSLSVRVAGVDQPRVFKSVNYDASKDPGVVQTNQQTEAGLTAGYGQGSGSFEMLVSELDDLFADLVDNDPTINIMDVDFDIIVSYAENDSDVRTDKLRGCRITKIGTANQQGTDASTKSCDIHIRRLEFNGLSAFGDPPQF